MPSKPSLSIDDEASVADHQKRVAAEGDAYAAAALCSTRPPETRARALAGALSHVAACLSRAGGKPSSVRQVASLASIVSSTVDDRVPVSALVDGANTAAQSKLLPVLGKLLCLLANVKNISDADKYSAESDASADELSGLSERDDEGDENDRSKEASKKRKGGKRSSTSEKKSRTAAGALRIGAARDCASSSVTGQEFVDEFVCRLSSPSSQFHNTQSTPGTGVFGDDVFVATIARESPLSNNSVVVVLENLLARLRRVDIFELPAFVYQLLLLVSSRGNVTSKRNVLRAVIVHFASLEDGARNATVAASQAQGADEDDVILSSNMSLSTVRQIESTTLLHIDFAVKQDPSLVTELSKLIRAPADSPNSIMVPFGMAILLALARSPSVQTTVLSQLADAIQRFDKEEVIRSKNLFAKKIVRKDDCLRDPRDALLCAIASTTRDGWDLICEPLLHLGFMLLDKSTQSWSTGSSRRKRSNSELGSDLVVDLFLLHPSLRREVVDQLIARVVLRERSSALAIHTIGRLARRSPSDLLECAPKIKESFADLVTLPPWTSNSLILAYKPLFRVRGDLRDNLFIVLRKALFHREACARAVASLGFLATMSPGSDIAEAFQEAPMSSQGPEISALPVEEAIPPLRRTLTHPPAIRALLYKEISRLVRSLPDCPDRNLICAEMHRLLQPHALRYVNGSDSPFLLLDHCINESAGGHLVEPLGDLLACLTAIQRAVSADFSTEYLVELARKVATVSVRDFDISKEVHAQTATESSTPGDRDEDGEDISNAGATADRAAVAADVANRNRTRLLGSVAEALLNVALSVDDAAHVPKLYTDTVFPLLQLREDALSVLKELGASSAADAVRDLGGNVDIEPGSGQAIGWALSNGSSGKPGRKSAGGKSDKGSKKKGLNAGSERSGTSGSPEGMTKFGSFGVLVSSSTCPLVTLQSSVICLASMYSVSTSIFTRETQYQSGATLARAGRHTMSEWFTKHRSSKETERLSLYLFAVAKRHVESTISTRGSFSAGGFVTYHGEHTDLSASLACLSGIAMRDFQHNRSQTGAMHSRLSVRSLELVELCITAVHCTLSADSKATGRICAHMLSQSSNRSASVADTSEHKSDDEWTSQAVSALQKTCHSLLEDGLFKEAEVVVRIISNLLSLYRDAFQDATSFQKNLISLLRNTAEWAQTALEVSLLDDTQTSSAISGTGDALVVQVLASLAMIQRESSDGLDFAKRLASRVSLLLGSALEDKGSAPIENEAVGPLALVTRANVLHVVDSILDVVGASFDDADWCLNRMMSLESVAVLSRASVSGSTGISPRKLPYTAMDDNRRADLLERQIAKAEDASHRRLVQCVDVLIALMSSAVGKWAHQERLLKSATRCYKLISISVGSQVRRRCDPRTSFLELIDVAKKLSPAVWDYSIFLNSDDGTGRGVAASAAKEARLMPQLVYEIERFEKLLISAAKRTKVNLLTGIKRNTARDYRITENESASDKENENESSSRVGPPNSPRR